jgi:hypothetical protein
MLKLHLLFLQIVASEKSSIERIGLIHECDFQNMFFETIYDLYDHI